MINAMRVYRRRVKRRLFCTSQTKRKLQQQLDASLALIQADDPNPTMERLVEGFGLPETRAAELLSDVDYLEIKKYHRRIICRKAALIVCFFLLLAFLILVWYLKSTPFEVVKTTVIYE